MKFGGSKFGICKLRWSEHSIPFEAIGAVLLGAFFIALSIGPRIPLPIDVGRRADLRIHEILILFLSLLAIYLLVFKNKPERLISPWSPWFLIAFISLLPVLLVKTAIAREQLFLNLGYSFRALMFFIISVTVFVIAVNTKSSLRRYTPPIIIAAFGINAAHIVINTLQGKNAFIDDLSGVPLEQYSPGLLGEPNALAAGIFFVYFLVVFAQWRTESLIAKVLLSIGVITSLVCVYMSNNRSVMIMAVVAIVLQLGRSLTRKTHVKSMFYALILVSGAVSFFILNPRGSAETISGALSYGRIPQWTRSLELIKDNPILGWNLGTNEPHQAFLRLWGELGMISATLFFILFLTIILRDPNDKGQERFSVKTRVHKYFAKEQKDDNYWLRVLKQFLVVLLIGGVLTDSLTPVQSWDLLSFTLGMAWASWYRGRAISTNFAAVEGTEFETLIQAQRKLLPE